MARCLGLLLLGLAVLVGCGTNPSPQGTNKGTVSDTTSRDEYAAKVRKHLDEVDQQMKEWQKKVNEAGADTRQALEAELKVLEKQRQQLGQQLEDVGKKSGQAWEEMRKGLDNGWDDLKKSFEKAREKFK